VAKEGKRKDRKCKEKQKQMQRKSKAKKEGRVWYRITERRVNKKEEM